MTYTTEHNETVSYHGCLDLSDELKSLKIENERLMQETKARDELISKLQSRMCSDSEKAELEAPTKVVQVDATVITQLGEKLVQLTQSLQDTQLDLQKQKVLHQNTLQELESLQLENEKLYHDIAHAQEIKKSEQKRKEARYEKLFKIMQTENETLEQASKNAEKFERALKEVSRVVKDDRIDSKDKLVYLRSMMILQQL